MQLWLIGLMLMGSGGVSGPAQGALQISPNQAVIGEIPSSGQLEAVQSGKEGRLNRKHSPFGRFLKRVAGAEPAFAERLSSVGIEKKQQEGTEKD